MELRPALQRFAEAMEMRLREFDGEPGKNGWLTGSHNENAKLADRMMVHAHETLREAFGEVSPSGTQELDAANYLMMIFDRNQDYPIGDINEG